MISGFEFRVNGFGFGVPGFGYRASGFGSKDSGISCWFSGSNRCEVARGEDRYQQPQHLLGHLHARV
jgi:hypothetical protein